MEDMDTTRFEVAEKEASILAFYFLKQQPPNTLKLRYEQYLSLNPPENLTTTDIKTIRFAMQHPFSIKFLDAGLAIVNPKAELRRRLYVIFSLLESEKIYSKLFLSQKRSLFYAPIIALVGVSAALKAVAGVILVKIVVIK